MTDALAWAEIVETRDIGECAVVQELWTLIWLLALARAVTSSGIGVRFHDASTQHCFDYRPTLLYIRAEAMATVHAHVHRITSIT